MVSTTRTVLIQQQFIRCLENCANVTTVCADLKLARRTEYGWRQTTPGFARAWDSAMMLGIDSLEDVAKQRAVDGSDQLLIFLLRGLNPEVYGQRTQVDLNQNLRVDLRGLSMDELRARLLDLRTRQEATPLTLALEAANVIDLDDHRD